MSSFKTKLMLGGVAFLLIAGQPLDAILLQPIHPTTNQEMILKVRRPGFSEDQHHRGYRGHHGKLGGCHGKSCERRGSQSKHWAFHGRHHERRGHQSKHRAFQSKNKSFHGKHRSFRGHWGPRK